MRAAVRANIFALGCGGLCALLYFGSPVGAQTPAGRPGAQNFGFPEPDPIDFEDHAGWVSMFDGKSLQGWDGDRNFWHIEDGAIVAESTCEKPTGTIYLVWQGGEPADFEMKLEMKGQGAEINSGVQYRGAIIDASRPRAARPRVPSSTCPSGAPRGTPPPFAAEAKWDMLGPQFDFDGRNHFTGQFYEQATGRGIIAWRGQVVRTEEGKHPRLLATLGGRDELAGYVHVEGWNQLHLIARGHTLTHIVNGHVMAMVMDDDATKFRGSGLIGFEIEGTGKIAIRNIWLKKL